jgi:hypothetical protein
MSSFPSNFGSEVPSEEYLEELRKWVEEHMDDKGFPPKSNALAEATIAALNNLNLNKIEEPTGQSNTVSKTLHFENEYLRMTDKQVNKLLIRIGLKRRIVAKDPKFYVCDKNLFTEYVSKEYLQNTELREMDEVYSMHEQILLHKETGLRFRYSTYENYDGDEVEYKFIEMFVLNNLNQKLEVFEVNMRTRIVTTKEGEISFDKLSKSKF